MSSRYGLIDKKKQGVEKLLASANCRGRDVRDTSLYTEEPRKTKP